VKRLGRKASHSLTSTEIKNEWSYALIPPHMPPLAGAGTVLPLKLNFHVRQKILFSGLHIAVGKKNIYK